MSGKFSGNTQLTPHYARTLLVSLIVVHHSLQFSLLSSLNAVLDFICKINNSLRLPSVPLSIPPFVGYTIFYLVKSLLYYFIVMNVSQ